MNCTCNRYTFSTHERIKMKWAQTLFYITGIVFFLIIIIAAIIFIRKVNKTSNAIKEVLTSSGIEDLIMDIKKRIPSFQIR